MNFLLNDVSQDISEQMRSISSLFDVIHLLPRDEIPSCILESEDAKVKALSNQLARLFKLELKASDTPNDKSKDLLGEAVVEILTDIASSPKLQALLQEDNSESSNSLTMEDKEKAKMLKSYIDQVRNVGCRDISISYQDDKMNASTLFKLIEKCKRLEEENKVMEESLDRRKAKLEKESTECDSKLEKTLKLCKETKSMAMCEHEKKDKDTDVELHQLTMEHEQDMAVLQTELSSIQQKRVDSEDEEHLQGRLVEIEMEREIIKQQHMDDKNKHQYTIQKIESNLRAETEEKNYLDLRYALVQSNKEIAEKESRLLQRVAAMEAKADEILFNAAVALQKIIRGARDRAKKKKGKKVKKGKKKGKGNKAKKG